jgi:hypothetical protein
LRDQAPDLVALQRHEFFVLGKLIRDAGIKAQ